MISKITLQALQDAWKGGTLGLPVPVLGEDLSLVKEGVAAAMPNGFSKAECIRLMQVGHEVPIV